MAEANHEQNVLQNSAHLVVSVLCIVKKAAPEKTASFHQHRRSVTSLLVVA
jgi:hypothetical protein